MSIGFGDLVGLMHFFVISNDASESICRQYNHAIEKYPVVYITKVYYIKSHKKQKSNIGKK